MRRRNSDHLPPFLRQLHPLLQTNYHTQIITISDPDGCLPNRILTLNLTGSPFSSASSQHYTFLNCTERDPLARVRVRVRDAVAVPCLSSENFTVYITTSAVSPSELAGQCRLVKSVLAPIMSFPPFDLTRFDPGPCFMHLRWDVPDCRGCVFSKSGRSICGFASKSGLQVGCIREIGLLHFIFATSLITAAVLTSRGCENWNKVCEKWDKLSPKLKRQAEYLSGFPEFCGWMMKKWLDNLMDWLYGKPKED